MLRGTTVVCALALDGGVHGTLGDTHTHRVQTFPETERLWIIGRSPNTSALRASVSFALAASARSFSKMRSCTD